ncbi:MAG: ribonuclease III [Tannerellaceae bacterium]|nr:ribonuclease III [Tannerellaceae bacterium]
MFRIIRKGLFDKIRVQIRLLINKKKEPYLSLCNILGFYPNNISLYEEAFRHKSSSVEDDNGKWKNNERLEFLGDAILDAVIADILYKHFPNRREGYLTNTRSKIVQREQLNRLALELGIHNHVVCATKLNTHNSYLFGNALEALVGAVYLDRGYRQCYRFIKEKVIDNHINLDVLARQEFNFKSSLIEWSQKRKLEIQFDVLESFIDNNGNPVFQSGITLLNRQIGIGIGYSKKESQQQAARMAIKTIRSDANFRKTILSYNRNNICKGPEKNDLDDLPDTE